MKRLLPIAVVLLSCIITCQAQGIAFVSTSWDETVQNAVKNDKQIFLYAQTKSCRYCRQMEKEVFTDPGVIDFYNKHFVSYKIDVDDDGPGEALSKQYGVMGFPTYLYFDKSGQKLHQSSALPIQRKRCQSPEFTFTAAARIGLIMPKRPCIMGAPSAPQTGKPCMNPAHI